MQQVMHLSFTRSLDVSGDQAWDYGTLEIMSTTVVGQGRDEDTGDNLKKKKT